MKKSIHILLFLICSPLFTVYCSPELEIIDPFGNNSNFEVLKFLDERNFSIEQGNDYSSFRNSVFSRLETSKIDDMYELIGDWLLIDSVESREFDYFRNRLQAIRIGRGEDGAAVLQLYGAVGPWEIFNYGEYYLSSFSTMGGIAPLLLINRIDDKLYFYTLENDIWKLLPCHMNGDVYLTKFLPNS